VDSFVGIIIGAKSYQIINESQVVYLFKKIDNLFLKNKNFLLE